MVDPVDEHSVHQLKEVKGKSRAHHEEVCTDKWHYAIIEAPGYRDFIRA